MNMEYLDVTAMFIGVIVGYLIGIVAFWSVFK